MQQSIQCSFMTGALTDVPSVEVTFIIISISDIIIITRPRPAFGRLGLERIVGCVHFGTGTRLTPRFAPAALSSEGKGHFYLVPWDDHNLSHPSLPFPAFSYFFLLCRAPTIFIVKSRRALTIFIFKYARP